MEPHDSWFMLAMGTCFLALAKPYGRALGYGMEGPRTSEQRARDAGRHTLVARIVGGTLVAFAGWRLLGL